VHLDYQYGTLEGCQTSHPPVTQLYLSQTWNKQYLPSLQQNQLLIHHTSELSGSAYDAYHQNSGDHQLQTLLIVPMLFGEELLGSITIRSRQHRNYKPEDLELARALAQQATLAIQLTRLAEQRRQTAVLEERTRMARDIHDSLAQSFTGIIMQLEAVKNLHSDSPEIHTRLCFKTL